MRVWQGDTPDSGGAAIMGVPLPHLVLPRSGVSSPDGGLGPMCLRCCGYIPAWFRPMVLLLWACGSPRDTQHVGLGSVCCLCIASRCVCVDRRRLCPHRRDVGPWYTAGVNGVATVLGTLVLRGCVRGNRGRRAHNGHPSGSGRLGDGCSCRSYPLVYLCRCGVRRSPPEDWYSMATHPSDPW